MLNLLHDIPVSPVWILPPEGSFLAPWAVCDLFRHLDIFSLFLSKISSFNFQPVCATQNTEKAEELRYIKNLEKQIIIIIAIPCKYSEV